MSRTNVNIDNEACAEVMRRYHLATKREAVTFFLRAAPCGGTFRSRTGGQ